jgi:glycosyltransferase involved in cell wall biosynthesis
VLALRAVDGAGGGADKIILRNAATVSPESVEMAVCFVHHADDREFDLVDRAAKLDLPRYEVTHQGPLDREVLPQLQAVVDDFQPDIIHSHDYKASFFATRLCRANEILRIATSHGWTGHKWREKRLLYPADKLMLRRFPAVIAVSGEIRDTLLRWGAHPDRVAVVLNGVDADHYRADESIRCRMRERFGFGPDHIVLGAVGRAEHQKRFDLLIEAFARLRPQHPEFRLVIAGDGSLLESLRADVKHKGLQDSCSVVGHCPDMIDTYQAFDMLVQSSDYEGTPTVVVEAMALRIPVVATDAGGTGQLIEDGRHGLLVPRRRIDALCQAIERCLTDKESTARRVQSARERVETTLSFQNRTRILEGIYAELMQHGRLISHRDSVRRAG